MKTLASALALSLLLSGAATIAVAQPTQTGPVGLTLTPVLETATTITGQPIRFPQGDNQFTAVLAEVAPGGQVGRHMHPVPLFVYMLEGTLSIEMDGHGTHTFSAGQGFAEVTNLWHNGRNLPTSQCASSSCSPVRRARPTSSGHERGVCPPEHA